MIRGIQGNLAAQARIMAHDAVAVVIGAVKTTTDAAVSSSTTIPITSTNGIKAVDTVLMTGIGVTATSPHVDTVNAGVSVVVSAAQTIENGQTVTFTGSSRSATIPADISDKILEQSKLWATQLAEELKYVGTLCVEFFIDRNENLYVNEIAPRVHNSGHLTINAYNVSQFENHVRAVCGLEQVPLKKISNAKMINLIGDQITVYRNKQLKPDEFFFDYLKKEIKPKRKMGHLTVLEK